MCEAGFSPTSTAARPGRMPEAMRARTCSCNSEKIWSRIFWPSRMRAVMQQLAFVTKKNHSTRKGKENARASERPLRQVQKVEEIGLSKVRLAAVTDARRASAARNSERCCLVSGQADD